MKSEQDNVPTGKLGKFMATDTHGRVLRRPYFLTREEHREDLVSAQREFTRRLEDVSHKWARRFVDEVQRNQQQPRIFGRRSLHWVIRRLVKVK